MDVVAVVLALLGVVFSLVTIVGVIAPSVFKDKKTGEVPKRLPLFVGGTVASVVALAISGSLMPQPVSQDSARVEPAPGAEVAAVAPPAEAVSRTEPAAAEPEPAGPKYKAPSPEALASATQYLSELDKAMTDSIAVLKNNSLPKLSAQSQRFNTLANKGKELFGSTVFEPLGHCFASGIHAQSWWQAQLAAAQNSGVESAPGWIKSALGEYQSNKAECLKSTDPIVAAEEDAELKEKFGGRECLTVFDLDPETKEVVTKPKPKHCKG